MTTRRLVLLVLAGVGVLLVVGTMAVLAVLRALPDPDDARRRAQAAADRVAPGAVRVLGAQWRGEAGGYAIRAALVADPAVSVGWSGDRRCEPGSLCESHLLTSLANGRDGAREVIAVRRALSRCGLPVAGEPEVQHEARYGAGEPPTIAASVTVVAPTAGALDACIVGWDAERGGLTPVRRYRAAVALADPDGRVHHTADVTVTDGRVTTTAASTLRPAS